MMGRYLPFITIGCERDHKCRKSRRSRVGDITMWTASHFFGQSFTGRRWRPTMNHRGGEAWRRGQPVLGSGGL